MSINQFDPYHGCPYCLTGEDSEVNRSEENCVNITQLVRGRAESQALCPNEDRRKILALQLGLILWASERDPRQSLDHHHSGIIQQLPKHRYVSLLELLKKAMRRYGLYSVTTPV